MHLFLSSTRLTIGKPNMLSRITPAYLEPRIKGPLRIKCTLRKTILSWDAEQTVSQPALWKEDWKKKKKNLSDVIIRPITFFDQICTEFFYIPLFTITLLLLRLCKRSSLYWFLHFSLFKTIMRFNVGRPSFSKCTWTSRLKPLCVGCVFMSLSIWVCSLFLC